MRTGGVSLLNPQWDERAVSPVVGMIMVLAISLTGTVAVMTWGLPAIDEMKSNVEVQSVKGQMQEFLADVQELVAGTAGKTAKRWQPTLQRGELYLNENTQPWIIAVDKRNATYVWNFTWGCAKDGASTADNVVCIKSNGPTTLTNPSLKVYNLSRSTETEGHVSGASTPGTVVAYGGSNGDRWETGEAVTVHLFNGTSSAVAWNLADRAVRVDVLNNSDVIASAWFFEAGDATFELNAGIQKKVVYVENGALFQGQGEDFVLLNSPPVPPPKTTGGANRMFVRFVELDGIAQFAGQHRNDVLLTLDSTSVREDLACPTTAASDDGECMSSVKLYPLGDRADEWVSFFTGSTYGFTRVPNNDGSTWDSDAGVYVMHRPGTSRATFTLVHSVIEVSG